MGGLLEVLGRAITVDTPQLVWHWLREKRRVETGGDLAERTNMDRIIDLMGQGKFGEAREHVRLHLFENASCTLGRMAAAALALQEGDLRHAIEELNSVYMRRPNNTLALYLLGHCYERLGYQAEAIEFYQDCIKFNDRLMLPAQRLGAIYFKEGRLEDTAAQYECIRQHYPDDIANLVTLGHLQLLIGRCDQAIETLNTAILIHPDNFITRDDQIDELIQSGQYEEALDAINVLLAGEPERADLIARQADILTMTGGVSDAIALYQQALRICPDFLEATIKLGTSYLKMRAEQLAARQFNRAIEINDAIVDAYAGLAAAQKRAGHEDEARNTLSLACAIQPNSAFLLAETGKLILKTALEASLLPAPPDGHTLEQTIVAAHQNHLTSVPQNPDLYYRLGLLYMNGRAMDRAADAFRAALRINPGYTRAATKLAVCLFETGHATEALDLIVPPRRYDATTLDLHYRTALLYADRVKFASSMINLQRQIERNLAPNLNPVPNISIVLQNLGLSDSVGLMWEHLCQTASHAAASV